MAGKGHGSRWDKGPQAAPYHELAEIGGWLQVPPPECEPARTACACFFGYRDFRRRIPIMCPCADSR